MREECIRHDAAVDVPPVQEKQEFNPTICLAPHHLQFCGDDDGDGCPQL